MERILIVEDDEHIQQGLVRLIGSAEPDLEVLATDHEDRALKILTEYTIDVFFLDIQLAQGGSGFELAKRIRTLTGYKMTPIVFITGLKERELEAYRELHCHHYLIKPFGEAAVRKILADIFSVQKEAKKEEPVFRISERSFSVVLKQSEIICLEVRNRHVFLTTPRETFELVGTNLQKAYQELEKNAFVQCHKSFIINRNYVFKSDTAQRCIWMREIETPIPVGRKYREDLEGIL